MFALIGKLIECEAYARPWNTYIVTPAASATEGAVLAAYAEHGLTKMLGLNEWQLTELVWRSTECDRSPVEFKPFFERRRVHIEQNFS